MQRYYAHYLKQGALMSAKLLILNSQQPFKEERFDTSNMAVLGTVRYYPYEFDGSNYSLNISDEWINISGLNPDQVAKAFGLKPEYSGSTIQEMNNSLNFGSANMQANDLASQSNGYIGAMIFSIAIFVLVVLFFMFV